MNEPFPELLTVWRFIRRYFVRIVIGAVLVAMVYGALLVWVPYQREQRIIKEIEAYGGGAHWEYFGPDWIPQSMRDRTTLFSRVTDVGLGMQGNDANLEHLNGLTNLSWLNIQGTQVTDAGLEQLKELSNLKHLDLNDNIHVTDAGLEHLKGLTNLVYLDLNDTQVTAEGRAMLRKALPDCQIEPDP